MIKATIILGHIAVSDYEKTGTIPDDDDIGGTVIIKEFKAKIEYDAYCEGLNDADGWEEALPLDPVYTQTPDCKHCESWRNFFADREKETFCPDCGKILNEPYYEIVEFEGEEFNIRTLDVSDELKSRRISTENLENKIFNDDGVYKSDEAEQLDNALFFYVPTDKITLPDNLLAEYIKQNIK